MRIEPYSDKWIRRLDFLPPLNLQATIDGQLNLYYCDAVVSTSTKIGGDVVPTEFGELRMDATNANKVHYIKGKQDPRREIEPVTQREIREDILSRGLQATDSEEVPGVVIQERGAMENMPDRLREEVDALATSEYIYRYERRSGNYNRMLSNRLNFKLFNPYQYSKGELLDRGFVKSPHDPVLRQIRSTLKTEWILPQDPSRGYLDLGPRLLTVEAALSREKWWETIGYPVPFEGTADHQLIKGQLFHLPSHGAFIIV